MIISIVFIFLFPSHTYSSDTGPLSDMTSKGSRQGEWIKWIITRLDVYEGRQTLILLHGL